MLESDPEGAAWLRAQIAIINDLFASYARPTSDDHLQFLIWCFGFFVGMRMSWTDAGFADATPVEIHGAGAMSDIMWLGDGLEMAISGADVFWRKWEAKRKIAKILTGAIHAYFLAQTRTLFEYEQFVYLYIAFEGCHAASETIAGRSPRATAHGARIRNLCVTFQMDVPTWADWSGNLQPAVTVVRNDALHEGLFFDEPLGFQGSGDEAPSKNIIAEMRALVSRFIVALLELPATDYIRSPISSRQIEGVRL